MNKNNSSISPNKVFVVHGRNEKARQAMFDFLRSLGLEPIEWEEAIAYTNKGAPFIGDILDHAFKMAQAVIVLITGDDIAKIFPQYLTDADLEYERNFTPQARPNVLFEAGLAFGRHPEQTIIVELGKNRPFSDIAGRHIIRISNNQISRMQLISRLKTARCSLQIDNNIDWQTSGDFDGALDNIALTNDAHYSEKCFIIAENDKNLSELYWSYPGSVDTPKS